MFLAKGGSLLTVYLGRHAGRALASSLPFGTALNQASSLKEPGIGLAGAGIGLGFVAEAWQSQYAALQQRAQAIADCIRNSPLANHSLAFLAF